MKQTIILLSFFAFTLSTQAAGDLWLEDFAAAQAQAKKTKRNILIDFTGSDWCPPCKALHRNVLSKKSFEDYAKKNLVLVVADFPRSKPQSKEQKAKNRVLAKKFQIRGYPTVVVLSPDGKVLMKDVGYGGYDADTFVSKLKKL